MFVRKSRDARVLNQVETLNHCVNTQNVLHFGVPYKILKNSSRSRILTFEESLRWNKYHIPVATVWGGPWSNKFCHLLARQKRRFEGFLGILWTNLSVILSSSKSGQKRSLKGLIRNLHFVAASMPNSRKQLWADLRTVLWQCWFQLDGFNLSHGEEGWSESLLTDTNIHFPLAASHHLLCLRY